MRAKHITKKDEVIMSALLQSVCYVFNIRETDIRLRSQDDKYVIPRQMFYYLGKTCYGISFTVMGTFVGQDHATAMHGKRKVQDQIDIKNRDWITTVDEIKKHLLSSMSDTNRELVIEQKIEDLKAELEIIRNLKNP